MQVGYYEVAEHATRAYLASLGYADLETRRVIPLLSEPRTVAAALGQMTWDNIAHGGRSPTYGAY